MKRQFKGRFRAVTPMRQLEILLALARGERLWRTVNEEGCATCWLEGFPEVRRIRESSIESLLRKEKIVRIPELLQRCPQAPKTTFYTLGPDAKLETLIRAERARHRPGEQNLITEKEEFELRQLARATADLFMTVACRKLLNELESGSEEL